MMGLGRAVCSEATWDGVAGNPVAEEAGEEVRDTAALDDARDPEERGGAWDGACVVWGSGVKESDVSIGLLVAISAV